MRTCNICGGLIGEPGTMISGRVCQCRVQMTSATSDTSDRTIIHSLSETVLRLTARLAEVEKELSKAKMDNEELKRDYVIQTPWNQDDEHEAESAKLGNEIFKLKEDLAATQVDNKVLKQKIAETIAEIEKHRPRMIEIDNELIKAKEDIAKKDFALRLAMNAFEHNWCIDWNEVESAISEGYDAAMQAEKE